MAQATHQTFSIVNDPEFSTLVKQLNPEVTDRKGNIVTKTQVQAAALSGESASLGKKSDDQATAEEKEKEQELLLYLQDKNEALKDPDLFIDATQEVLDRIKKSQTREVFGQFPAVVKLLISPQGIIIGLTELPRELSLEALKVGIALFKEIKKHPNDLGYKAKLRTVHARINGLVKALTRRKKN